MGRPPNQCLSVTIHDIKKGKEEDGSRAQLLIRNGKGEVDRIVPLAKGMLQDLRDYWNMHKHPLLLFPNAGRGVSEGEALIERMNKAIRPMPHGSLQRLIVVARKELNLPQATPHSLRHSHATHLIDRGVDLLTVQRLMGHKNLKATLTYLHVTDVNEQNARCAFESLWEGLPR